MAGGVPHNLEHVLLSNSLGLDLTCYVQDNDDSYSMLMEHFKNDARF